MTRMTCSHNFMSDIHKVSDHHHFHHEQQQWPVMTLRSGFISSWWWVCINETAEKSPHRHFGGNVTRSAVITFWESLTTCQTVTFLKNSSDELPWLPSDFISSWWWV
jgi:hypothetical protein